MIVMVGETHEYPEWPGWASITDAQVDACVNLFQSEKNLAVEALRQRMKAEYFEQLLKWLQYKFQTGDLQHVQVNSALEIFEGISFAPLSDEERERNNRMWKEFEKEITSGPPEDMCSHGYNLKKVVCRDCLAEEPYHAR
jgi:hypothetical protein